MPKLKSTGMHTHITHAHTHTRTHMLANKHIPCRTPHHQAGQEWEEEGPAHWRQEWKTQPNSPGSVHSWQILPGLLLPNCPLGVLPQAPANWDPLTKCSH